MDLHQERFLEARVEGTADPLKLKGPIRGLLPKLALWLHSCRNGDITVRISTKPIQEGATAELNLDASEVLSPPEPTESDSWDTYYLKLVDFFDGADSMAEFLANEAFDRPQHPWLGDSRAARFIHMNASVRLFEKADPTEYAALAQYVESKYPALYSSLPLKG